MTIMDGFHNDSGGTNTHLGIAQGLDLLSACTTGENPVSCSDADVKIMMLMTDGQPSSVDSMMRAARREDGQMLRPDVEIYTITVNDGESLFATMKFVSNDECEDRFFTGPYTDSSDCGPSELREYAYWTTSAEGADGVSDVYQNITNSVLGVTVGFISEGQLTTKELLEGANKELPFPESFLCTGTANAVPLRVNFSGDGTVHLSNFLFNYCPAD